MRNLELLTHRSLQEFTGIPSFSKYKVGVLSLEYAGDWFTEQLSFLPSFLKNFIMQLFLAFRVALRAVKLQKNVDYIIFLEYFDQFQLLTVPLLLFFHKKLFFVINHNQNQTSYSFWQKFMFFLFKSCPFKFILFELDDSYMSSSLRVPKKRLLVLPHPVSVSEQELSNMSKKRQDEIRIGISGKIRKDKNPAHLAKIVGEYLRSHNIPAKLLVGLHPGFAEAKELGQLGFTVVDTRVRQYYLPYLASIDISIQWFDKKYYYYRPSGTIMDGASVGSYVLCPNYPVFSNEVSWPVRRGECFESLDELLASLKRVIDNFKPASPEELKEYREKRSAEAIAKLFDDFIDKQKTAGKT